MEAQLMLWIHSFAGPRLDTLAWLSHLAGTIPFCAVLVLGAAGWCLSTGQRRLAVGWMAVGLLVLFGQSGLKLLVARARPRLWEWGLVQPSDYSFPSGHAFASAAFYPLLAYTLSRRFPAGAPWLWSLAALAALSIGLGRLYLGVHWPSDVVAGWTLGAALCAVGIGWVRQGEPRSERSASRALSPNEHRVS